MADQTQLVVSHAPFWHNGSSISQRSYNTMLAALLSVLPGVAYFGMPALAVMCISISSAMIWEMLFNLASRRPFSSLCDGNSALLGMLFGMLVPASLPWWAVLTGTFFMMLIGKLIYGGTGANPFNPVLIGLAIMLVSWPQIFDFDYALANLDMGYNNMAHPLYALKHMGPEAAVGYSVGDLLAGRQSGGIGSVCGYGLILGGIYLMARGFIRWEISISFLAGIFITALIFWAVDSSRYASPFFHMFTGYTLVAAFFLVTEDSSSPVNFLPMLIYGAGAGVMTMLIRNIGAYDDGSIQAILVLNLAQPLIDRIRPKAMGKAVEHA